MRPPISAFPARPWRLPPTRASRPKGMRRPMTTAARRATTARRPHRTPRPPRIARQAATSVGPSGPGYREAQHATLLGDAAGVAVLAAIERNIDPRHGIGGKHAEDCPRRHCGEPLLGA